MMLDYLRFALYAVVAAIGFSLVQLWQSEHPTINPSTANAPVNNQAAMATPIPTINNAATPVSAITPAVSALTTPREKPTAIAHIQNDVLSLDIDTHGGNIIKAQLLKYPETLNSAQGFILMNNQN